jgi:hypothetical protein
MFACFKSYNSHFAFETFLPLILHQTFLPANFSLPSKGLCFQSALAIAIEDPLPLKGPRLNLPSRSVFLEANAQTTPSLFKAME